MKTTKRKAAIAIAAAFAIGGALHAGALATDTTSAWTFGTAYAQSHSGGPGGSSGGQDTGGHDSGSTGGHDSGSTGGHDTGSTGGHDSGGGCGGGGCGGGGDSGGHSGGSGGKGGGRGDMVPHRGAEAPGHGTRYQHKGHAAGTHGAASAHAAGANRFGGGSGVSGNSQVPEGVGRYGAGFASDSLRTAGGFRYWGGWTLPGDPTDPGDGSDGTVTPYLVTTTTTDIVPGPGGGPSINVRNVLDSSPRCEGVAAKMPATEQFGSANLRRLNGARSVIDPALAESGKLVSPYLMANLQEELVKPKPDPQLAGTYLGLVAKTPVTPEKVKQVGFQLCVVIADAQAEQISSAAEQQRRSILASTEKK